MLKSAPKRTRYNKYRGNRDILLLHIYAGESYETLINIIIACKIAYGKVGINSTIVRLDESVSQEDLLLQIDNLNQDPDVDGILCQLPLPGHISLNNSRKVDFPQSYDLLTKQPIRPNEPPIPA